MVNTTTKTLTGRIQGTPDTLGYNAIITDADTGEMIEGVDSIQITMKPHVCSSRRYPRLRQADIEQLIRDYWHYLRTSSPLAKQPTVTLASLLSAR